MYVSPEEASKRYGVHIATLKKWAKDGKINHVLTPGGHCRYWIDEKNKSDANKNKNKPIDIINSNPAQLAISSINSDLDDKGLYKVDDEYNGYTFVIKCFGESDGIVVGYLKDGSIKNLEGNIIKDAEEFGKKYEIEVNSNYEISGNDDVYESKIKKIV